MVPMFNNETTVKDVVTVLINVTCLKLSGFDWFICSVLFTINNMRKKIRQFTKGTEMQTQTHPFYRSKDK